ncbi:MAG: hypothetical protein ABIQ66_05540 [Novosphingobium sp.]
MFGMGIVRDEHCSWKGSIIRYDTTYQQSSSTQRNRLSGASFIKQQAWCALDESLETALASERVFQRRACPSEDFAEGVNAFLEKRQPKFKGL